MKVVITGGGGSGIGTGRGAVGAWGIDRGIRQHGTDRGTGAVGRALWRRPNCCPARRMEGDITEQAVIEEAIGGAESFSIFHLASMVSGECEERYDDALRVNLDGGRHIFEAARAATGQPRVVFASSVASRRRGHAHAGGRFHQTHPAHYLRHDQGDL